MHETISVTQRNVTPIKVDGFGVSSAAVMLIFASLFGDARGNERNSFWQLAELCQRGYEWIWVVALSRGKCEFCDLII